MLQTARWRIFFRGGGGVDMRMDDCEGADRIDMGICRIGCAPIGRCRGVKEPVYHSQMVHRVFCLCARIGDWLVQTSPQALPEASSGVGPSQFNSSLAALHHSGGAEACQSRLVRGCIYERSELVPRLPSSRQHGELMRTSVVERGGEGKTRQDETSGLSSGLFKTRQDKTSRANTLA